jgi:Protein of unknown function (DUF3828)
MKRRIILLLGVLAPLGAQAQQAMQQTAQAFLESLYAPYRAKGFNGQPYTQAERFFEPTLAAAMQRDYQLAQKNGVPPTLNGDPFVDAQEWEVSNLSIRAASSGEQATGMVSFMNFKQKKTLAVELVQTGAGWRIADIAGAGGSLRALYKVK